MASVVAARYARALVEVVVRPGSGIDPDGAVAQLRAFDAALRGSAGLRNILLSPAVSAARKKAVAKRIAARMDLARQIGNFLLVVIDHRRVSDFSAIADAFEELLDEQLGFVRADVTSAQELTAAQRQDLESRLAALSGKRARPRYRVDPSLIGGAIAKVGSTVYDGSVRGEIGRLRAKLAASR